MRRNDKLIRCVAGVADIYAPLRDQTDSYVGRSCRLERGSSNQSLKAYFLEEEDEGTIHREKAGSEDDLLCESPLVSRSHL